MEALQVGTIETKEVSYVDTMTATNRFSIDDGIALLTLWGGDKGEIQMDGGEFEIKGDTITLSDIFENLDDGQFGVQSIDGARELCVSQILEVKRVYSDGKVEKFESSHSLIEWQELSKENGKLSLF